MMRTASLAVVLALAGSCWLGAACASESETPSPPSQSWRFNGLFGRVDHDAARRGFEIFNTNCASCHALNYVHYRDLSDIGFTGDEIQAIAAKAMVPAGVDEQGRIVLKPATAASPFRAPFATDDAARAAFNGALPPDLSMIVNSSANGADTIYAILTGYTDPPAGTKMPDGMNYNRYVPGHFLAMPPPLDGDVPQQAHDVVTFLDWTANPETDARKHMGIFVIPYFLGMAGIAYGLQKRVWGRWRD
jgi:ubiquinol-cytochrome c reductase cytochrome c1 subunit